MIEAHEVRVKNNWGALVYTAGGRNMAEGMLVQVEWPDGSTSIHQIGATTRVIQVHDHGHSNSVKRTELWVAVEHRGLTVEVPLAGLWVVVIGGDDE